jgi:hypothetical protein
MHDMGDTYEKFKAFNLAMTSPTRHETLVSTLRRNAHTIDVMDLDSGCAFPAYKVFFNSLGKIV